MNWSVVILAALATMRLTEFLKEVIPWPLQPWTKSGISLVIAGALCALHSSGGSDWTLASLGAAGLAAVLHDVRSVLSMKSDDLKQTIMVRYANKRRVA